MSGSPDPEMDDGIPELPMSAMLTGIISATCLSH